MKNLLLSFSLLDEYERVCQTSKVFFVTVFIKKSSEHFYDASNPLFHQHLKVDFKSITY